MTKRFRVPLRQLSVAAVIVVGLMPESAVIEAQQAATASRRVMHPRRFEPSPCPQGIPVSISVDCGFLVVPENRRENGRSSHKEIRIAVATARASSGVALPDPIVFVPGGPSAAAIDPGIIFVLASLFGANRDVILVDARG